MSSTETLCAGNRTAKARLPSGVNTTWATLSGMATVSVTLTSVPLIESTLIELSPRLATSAILPDGLMLSPEGCLPAVLVAAGPPRGWRWIADRDLGVPPPLQPLPLPHDI